MSIRLFFITVFLLAIPLRADMTVDVLHVHNNLIPGALLLKDPEKKMDIDRVRGMGHDQFVLMEGDTAGFAFSSAAYWFRIALSNPTDGELKRLLSFEPTWLDHIDAWTVAASGEMKHFAGGDRFAYSLRDISDPQTLFELSIRPGETTLYVRIETRDPFVVVMNLWEENAYFEHKSSYTTYIGFFYGVLAAMVIYNLFLFVTLRDRMYAFYVLYISSFWAMNFTYSGFSFPLLWPDSPEWGNWAHSIIIYIYTLCGLFFAMVFLNTKRELPRLHRIVSNYMILVGVVFVVSSLSGGYGHNVATSIMFVVGFAVMAFAMGVTAWINGNRTARFFILATTAGLFGAATTAFTVSSILPFSFVTYRAADIGMMLDAMLLSLALADRYKSLERERDLLSFKESQQQELLAQKEAFAKSLEARVREELEKNKKQEEVMLKQYQQATMGNMIGVIAHQLKQPLNAIGLYIQDMAETAREGRLDVPTVEKFQEKMWQSVQFMSMTIDEFRNFFRPDKIKKEISLPDVIQKTLSLLDKQLVGRDVAVTVSCDDAIRIQSYESELQQVMMNLIVNALDIFEERKVHSPKITIRVEKAQGGVFIRVLDNGGGIPDAALPHMFELYYTTKGQKGTGLGLYMSKMIVTESLKGEIDAKNGKEGAEFEIRLPLSETA